MTKQPDIFEFPITTGDANGNAIAMDELTYGYESGNGNSNLLTNVSDAVSNQNTGGFKDGNTNPSLNDYEYDGNGNKILDRNKGIENITYNHLNLPTKITWANNKYIAYQYNAAGQKIRKTVEYNDSLKIVDYLDGFQYAGNVLQFFPTTEGYVKATPLDRTNTSFAFNYIYNYTDHLGNVRISYTKDPKTNALKIVDESHYYPFGLKHGVYVPSSLKDFKQRDTAAGGGLDDPVKLVNVNKAEYQYKYNGFEYQDELNLNWYDYKARNYDPAIGRWMNIDPLAETSRKFSLYAYTLDNPVFFIDPDGMKAEASSDSSSSDKNKVSSGIAGIKFDLNNRVGAMSYENYSENYSTNTSQKNSSVQKNTNAKNLDNKEPNKTESSENQDCCPDKKPKIEVKLSLSSETKSINQAFVHNHSPETVYYKSEDGSDKKFINTNGAIHEKVDGIRVGNTVIKVSDGYRSVVVDKNGNVNITYGDPVTYGIYLWKGGELKSSPGSNWNALFDKK